MGEGLAAARLVVGAVALVVLVWLGLGLRAALLEGEGAELAGSTPATTSAARLAEARDAYRRAREFNADSAPEVREAGLANFSGRRRDAMDLLREVTRREPENADAWILLAGIAGELDPALAARATERARELNPLAFRPRG